MKQDRYVFPAVFEYGNDESISVYFPDLDGCVSEGKNEEDALFNAKEALSLHLYGMEVDGDLIPSASKLNELKLDNNESAVLVDTVYMPVFRDKMSSKAIKKTLTIPSWLNVAAEAQDINFSLVLQEALKKQLGING